MEEILFRAKSRADMQWKYGSLIVYNDSSVAIHSEEDGKTWPCDDESVGQYTGLRDKGDIRIFEGDIVKDGGWIGEIKWCGAGYDDILAFHPVQGDQHYNHYHGGWAGIDFEVIGNIHDDRDLLK